MIVGLIVGRCLDRMLPDGFIENNQYFVSSLINAILPVALDCACATRAGFSPLSIFVHTAFGV
jgi:hypothetical protein